MLRLTGTPLHALHMLIYLLLSTTLQSRHYYCFCLIYKETDGEHLCNFARGHVANKWQNSGLIKSVSDFIVAVAVVSFEIVSLCSPGWTVIWDSPASTSQVLELQVCMTIPGLVTVFILINMIVFSSFYYPGRLCFSLISCQQCSTMSNMVVWAITLYLFSVLYPNSC